MRIYLICEVNSLEKEGIQDDENKKKSVIVHISKTF